MKSRKANYELGELRRSSLLYGAGIGSLVNFRVDGATVSAIICGQEDWDSSFPETRKGARKIYEPRLQARLGVDYFRAPPVREAEAKGDKKGELQRLLPALTAAPFPRWLHCPSCGRLALREKWKSEPGLAAVYCPLCSSPARKAWVVPAGFILACERGHLEEFPWHFHVGHKPECKFEKGFLKLEQKSPGLAGLRVSCPECGASRSMAGVFDQACWKQLNRRCNGLRPWLDAEPEECDRNPRVMKCGASNLYYPLLAAALSIPPWAENLQEDLGETHWAVLKALLESGGEELCLRHIEKDVALQRQLAILNLTPEKLLWKIRRQQDSLANAKCEDLRPAEYEAFESAREFGAEFELAREKVPEKWRGYLGSLIRATRLREVRALTGFSRIYPPDDERGHIAEIAANPAIRWRPAIEAAGEGIFLTLDQERLKNWEKQPAVRKRAQRLRSMLERRLADQDSAMLLKATPRFMLLHSLSHALMIQLAVNSGYGAAALSERLYADETMAGLLIYTACVDSGGTLGGLQRQGASALFGDILQDALQAQEWCASDPLCIQGLRSSAEGLSIGACHSCLFVPETACEEYNRFLDRGFLIGWPEEPEAGYFCS